MAPRLGHQPSIETPRARQLLHDLGEAGHAVVAIVLVEGGPGGGQPRPAEADDLDAGLAAAQLLGERGRVEVAARFSAGDEDARHRAGGDVPGAAPAARRDALQIDRGEIELVQLDQLVVLEAGLFQLGDELGGVADEHDRQAARTQVGARHALDVLGGDAIDLLRVVGEVLQVEAVEDRVQHLQRDRVGRLDGQREVAGEERLRRVQLALVDRLLLQADELVDGQPKGLDRRLGPGIGVRDDGPGPLERVHLGRGAVGEAAIGAQHALQPVAAFAAEDLHRQVERHVVLVSAADGELADADLGLDRAGSIDDDDATGRVGRIRRGRRRHVALRPVAERLGHRRHGGVDAHVADEGDQRVVRVVPAPVERHEIVARQRRHRVRRPVARLAVGMEAEDQALDHRAGHVVRILVAHLQRRQQLLALPLELLGREGRPADDVGEQLQPLVQVARQQDGVGEGQVGAGAGAEVRRP